MKKWLKKNLPKPIIMLYYYIKVTKILIITFKPKYNQDELITSHNCDFMNEENFKNAYSSAVKLGLHVKDSIHWRAHTCCWAGTLASKLDGDFVECGVNKGFLSKIVMDYTEFKNKKNKTFFLFDTYEGLVEELLTENEKSSGKTGGMYENCYDLVINVFSEYKNVEIVKGFIPESLNNVEIEKVAYLSIDMNCVVPEIEAMKYFWPKMVKGGIVILDDYGHAGHEAQKEAFDEFALENDTNILYLPTGQGLLIKD